jgi:ribosomal protein S18
MPPFKKQIKRKKRKKRVDPTPTGRFLDRDNKEWGGRLIDYKEVDLLRKFLTSSHKLMSRKRSGTSAKEQRALRTAIRQARFMGLIPYTGP